MEDNECIKATKKEGGDKKKKEGEKRTDEKEDKYWKKVGGEKGEIAGAQPSLGRVVLCKPTGAKY